MATHLTEEEQIESFKRWWSENWVTIILPLIVCVFFYVGWYWWQDQKTEQAEMASDKYEELSTLLSEAQGTEGLTDKQKAEVIAKAEGIVSEYSKTLYADMANLILGGLYVEGNELDKAANFINRVAQNGSNDAISLLARSRLAKVYLTQGRTDDALMLVAQTDDEAFKSVFAEIRGDVLLAKGEVAAANTAYQSALDNLSSQSTSRSGLLQAKISATAVAGASAEITPEPLAAQAAGEPE